MDEPVILIGEDEYTENTPAARVWETTSCKGDMNNDDSLDFDDIDPFLLAVSDPQEFADEFPGLGPAIGLGDNPMLYHGDFDGDGSDACDGVVDGHDGDAIAKILSEQCCISDCDDESCASFGPGGGPEAFADNLGAYVSPAGIDALVEMMQGVMESLPPERQEFWEDVFEALGY